MKNRDVVKKDAFIIISNMMNIGIWNSPWIPLLPDFKAKPNVNLVDLHDFCVSNLILPHETAWNRMLLQDLFYPSLVECILNIHLSQLSSFDKWTWALSPFGLFSVKSVHEVSLPSRNQVSPPSYAWHKLWELKLQARLKHLL